MNSKLGTVLDIIILLIGPWILYTRVLEIIDNGASLYPVISIIIITLAVVFAVYNLYHVISARQQNNSKK
ncbi:hypothetical protein HU147_13360 [Planomicrobium chinense]|uniref:Uncharacterized protein n=2 Tax=Planococcus TaxID=1372 RepID=A0A1G7ZXZ6_9BACL|nr:MULTISPECIES: hypothetical protein [Planococcus]MCP2036295.1 putative membrane-anchored protein [Planomicrobium sp. HSC-17F08]ETP70022.1 hypothetical protein G159_03965 [Planococcus glaciei CHR43]KOF11316.1 hypothetical protein AC739_05610 [Planococcus glaciei]MBX0313966.1 hypothetical protein [Planococcus glaciei]MBZ5202210.1 hypothetical protein [Planococcus chinensis]